MRLTLEGIADRDAFEAAGIGLPTFDVAAMQAAGRRRPRWLHIGPGNIFRVFLARLAHDMLADGHPWPVTAVTPMDPGELDVQLAAHDYLTLGVTLNPDGARDLRVLAGISEGLATRREADMARVLDLVARAEVTLVTFTITEKGYVIHDSAGRLSQAAREAIASDPRGPQPHTMALVASSRNGS